MIERYRLRVYGTRGPQGSKRRVGHGQMIESSKKVRPWRELVHYEGLTARRSADPLDEPLWLRMVFTLPKPQSAPVRRTTYPMRTPDLSKLTRSTEDALTTCGLWRDDARVVEYLRLAKVFPNEDPEALEAPGCLIVVFSKQ